jgi:hypothetical protein
MLKMLGGGPLVKPLLSIVGLTARSLRHTMVDRLGAAECPIDIID